MRKRVFSIVNYIKTFINDYTMRTFCKSLDIHYKILIGFKPIIMSYVVLS